MAEPQNKSYGQILKSSALIGGSSAFTMGLGIIRTKAMALLLGPAGVGILGLYVAISDLVRNLAGLGINSSGVRQIAEAVGSGDEEKIACTVTTLRRVALISGIIGALILVGTAGLISKFTFENPSHTVAIALLALVAFFGDISLAQGALVQGMRRIGDLARMNILGALYGTIFGIGIVWFFKIKGLDPLKALAPSLVCVAGMSIVTSWWYARKIKVRAVNIPWSRVFDEASALVKLGLIFMASGLATLGSAYLVRKIVLDGLGDKAAGYYQAAWGLSGLYIGFILQAMTADFYPRLTGVANNNEETNRLVNEQTEIGLLMAGPGILGTLTLAPLAILIFYTGDFAPAVEVLRWFCLGMLLKVVNWPMGFIILARGERALFFWTEVLTNVLYVALVWAGIRTMGLRGVGVAFFALYAINLIAVYIIVRRLTGFRLSTANKQISLLFAPLVAVVFVLWYFLPPLAAISVGGVLAAIASVFSIRILCKLIPPDRLPRAAQKMFRILRLMPSNPKKKLNQLTTA